MRIRTDFAKNNFDDLVNGWAEIAAFLGRSVRTAQRWAGAGRFSILKVPGMKPSQVYARRTDIGPWRSGNSSPCPTGPMGAGLAHESPTDTFKHHEYLWGWKVIACFLNLSVRTAQRWEHEAKLPVHRLHTGRKAFPYAMESELSGWIKERTASRQSPPQVDKRLPPLMQSFLDSMTAPIAVLDARGTIIAVNKAWRVFSSANGYRDSDLGIGRNYFEVCGSAACVDAATASRVAEGLAEFLAGKRPDLKVKYRCDRPTEKRDFLLSATRFEGLTSPFLVLSHSDVTNVL